MDEGINVVSLFDGMSCGQIALDRSKIKVKNYFASEIKDIAIKVTKDNYPETIHIGSVEFVTGDMFLNTKIDLLIGESPCKGISGLNKNQEGLNHSESRLFWDYVRILKALRLKNPKLLFLLENTHGNKESTKLITEALGVKPLSINSKLVSAQNRPRYYWTNIPYTEIEDRNITTDDIFHHVGQEVTPGRKKWLESESGKKSIARSYTRVNPYPKAGCLTANGHAKWNCNYKFKDGVYRYLTQWELEKLQTIPIFYTSCLSYTQAYDVIGDGWTVDIICEIFKGIKQ
jgi:DNA (cytosine-5)-methyltransferase 3A